MTNEPQSTPDARICPQCKVGKNSADYGGTDLCFHCSNDDCDYVQCIVERHGPHLPLAPSVGKQAAPEHQWIFNPMSDTDKDMCAACGIVEEAYYPGLPCVPMTISEPNGKQEDVATPCCPSDQKPQWLLRFDDPERGDAYYDTAEEAEAAYDAARMNWTVTLFAPFKRSQVGELPPPTENTVWHRMNCASWFNDQGHEVNGEDCTCGLRFRIQVQTEQAMHAAWRKRAEEAESELIALREQLAMSKRSLKLFKETAELFQAELSALREQQGKAVEVLQSLQAGRVGSALSLLKGEK